MKTKMNALDVKASVAEMQSVVGLRLINIYDINAKIFLFKFGHGENKKMLLVESGVRMHLTNLVREKPKMPSQFTFKLRKHVKSWRLEKVEQCASDRTIVMRFGSEQTCFFIIVELYARGNVILTDNDMKIMMLLRSHKDGDVKYSVNETYLLPQPPTPVGEQPDGKGQQQLMFRQASVALSDAEPDSTLRSTLTAVDAFGPHLAVHAILLSGLEPDLKKGKWPSLDVLMKQLEPGLLASFRLLRSPISEGGFLIRAGKGSAASDATQGTTGEQAALNPQQLVPIVKYEDFSPVLLQQFSNVPGKYDICSRSKFSDVADEFFCYFEMEKIQTHNDKKQNVAVSPVERLERQHKQRISKLESERNVNEHKAYLLQKNAQAVQEALDLINTLIANRVEWEQMRLALRERRREGHPVAEMIHSLNLDRGTITVLLEEDLEDEQEDCDIEPTCVEIDLALTAQRNAGKYFTSKKAVNQKLDKTVAATDKALAGAARKGAKQAAKAGPQKKEVYAVRTEYWFEKFYWFISSGGNICLSGRDKQQTDLLIQRYMRDGDIFVHSDATNAFPYLVKGKAKCEGIPLISVKEAGAMVVNRSACWMTKSSASPWWVYASQVIKGSAGSGCHLNPGMFHITGSRTYFKPMPLAFGVTLLFRVSGPRNLTAPDASQPQPETLEEVIPNEEIPVRVSSGEGCKSASSDVPSPSAVDDVNSVATSSHVSSQRRQRCKVSKTASSSRNAGTSLPSSDDGIRSSQRSSSSAQAAAAMAARRALAKKRKIERKYAEQDEEDVARAMALHGNPVSKVHQELLAAAARPPAESSTKQQESLTERQSTEEGLEEGEAEGDENAPMRVRFRSVEHEASDPVDEMQSVIARKQQSAKEDYEKATQVMNEDLQWDLFTGEPQETDVVEFCLPMVTTADRVRGRRYAAEITVGQEKKGTAATHILSAFEKIAEANTSIQEGEKRAIALASKESLTIQLPPNLKIHFHSTKTEKNVKRSVPSKEALLPQQQFVDPVA